METSLEIERGTYRYRTSYNSQWCLGFSMVILAVLAVLGLVVAIIDWNLMLMLKGLLCVLVFLIVSIWVLCFHVTLFYDDYLEIFFPLRLRNRKIRMGYKELEYISFNYIDRWGDYMVLHPTEGTPSYKRCMERVYLSPLYGCCECRSRKVKLNYLYRLRFLKQKGVTIRAGGVGFDRLELAFGPGDRYIPRMSVAQRKEEGKSMLLLLIIVGLWFALMMGFMLSLVQW